MNDRLIFRMTPDGAVGLQTCSLVPSDGLLTSAPAERGHVVYSDRGRSCGVWEATPYAERIVDFPADEMALVLSGKVRITPDNCEAEAFGEGECYFMRKGFSGSFEVLETCRKYYLVVE